jgi:hypothetical protein
MRHTICLRGACDNDNQLAILLDLIRLGPTFNKKVQD